MNNDGFFSRLLKGAIAPAARLSLAQQKFSNKLFGGTGQVEDSLARNILGSQKYQAVQQNPFTEGLLKPLASGASYGVQAAIAPIKGAGLLANAGRLVKGGAVAGGLGGVGEALPGQELESAGKGATAGAVLNLLTGGLTKKQNLKVDGVMGQLDDIAVKNTFKGTTPNQLRVNKVDPKEFNSLAIEIIDKAKKFTGKSTVDATDIYNAKNDIVNEAGDEIGRFAGKVIKDGKAKIGKQIAPLLEKKIGTYDKLFGNNGDDVAKEALDIYKGMSNNPTVGEIRAFWQKLIEAQGGFDKAVRGAGRGNNELNLLKKLSEVARKAIETGGPEVSQAMKKFSTIDEFLEVFTKNYPKTQSSGLGNNLAGNLLGDVVNVTSAKAKGSQALAKLFNVGGMNEGTSLLNKVAPSIGGGMAGGAGQEPSLDMLRGQEAMNQTAPTPYQLNLPAQQNNLYSALLQATQLLPGGSVAQQYELAQGILEQSQAQAEQGAGGLITVGDIVSGAVPDVKLTDNDKDYVQARLALEDALNYVESEGGAGKLSTIGGGIAGFFGQKTSSSQYKAKVQNAVATLRKALIGAGQTEAEMKNLNMPKPTDEPALAAEKIRAIIDDISRRPVGAGQMVVTQ